MTQWRLSMHFSLPTLALILCSCGAASDPAAPAGQSSPSSLASLHARGAELEQPPDAATSELIEEAIVRGWPAEARELKAHLAANAELLSFLSAALRENRAPAANSTGGATLQQDAKRLQRLLLLDGLRAASEGRDDEALATFVDALAFARRHSNEPGSGLQGALAGWSLEKQAYAAIRELIQGARASVHAWQKARTDIERLHSERREFDRVFAEEMALSVARLKASFAKQAESMETTLSSTSTAMIEAYARRADSAVATFELAHDKQRLEELRAWADGLSSEAQALTARVATADTAQLVDIGAFTVLATAVDAFAPAFELEFVRRAEFEMLRASIAVVSYQLRSGAVPASLAELVPQQLSSPPVDPFGDGASLRIARDGRAWWVYSVGPDRIDQGGRIRYDSGQPSAGGDLFYFGERRHQETAVVRALR